MRYGVVFEPFTERHYVKTFAKKYKGAWNTTLNGLTTEFMFMDALLEKSIAKTISRSQTEDIRLCKTEFKIAGTQESRRGSGNRCIVAVHDDTAMVHVLLVYAKTDVGGDRETDWWKQTIRDNYPEYRKLF